MTISTSSSIVTLQGNNATTHFAYSFLIPDISNVQVIYTDLAGQQVTLLGGQFSITGIGNPLGGEVTYPLAGPPIQAGTFLTIARVLPIVQGTSISNQGPVFVAIETALDYLTMLTQEGSAASLRSITFPLVDINPQGILPVAGLRANKSLGFDSLGNVIAGSVTGTFISSVMYPVVQASSLLNARLALGVGAGDTRVITGSDSLIPADLNRLILAETGAPATFALLPAGVAGVGFEFELQRGASANHVTVTASEAFWNNGQTSLVLSAYARVKFWSTGTQWVFSGRDDGRNETRAITGADSLVRADHTRLILAEGSAPFTFALLPAATAGLGFEFEIQKGPNANPVVIAASEAFWNNGLTSLVIGPSDRIKFRSTGSAWVFTGYPQDVGVSYTFTHPSNPGNQYLLENGQAISRAVYVRYWNLVGTLYGPGDGSTTFNLRDKRGRVDVHADQSAGRMTGALAGGMVGNFGSVGGEQAHALVTAEIPNNIPTTEGLNGNYLASGSGAQPVMSTDGSIHVGGNGAHNNVQPSITSYSYVRV